MAVPSSYFENRHFANAVSKSSIWKLILGHYSGNLYLLIGDVILGIAIWGRYFGTRHFGDAILEIVI